MTAVLSNELRTLYSVLVLLVLVIVCSGCQTKNCEIEPTIFYVPTQSQIESLPSAFPPLTKEEARKEWGRELYLGARFACELDYYRAITAFKRALFLLSKNDQARRNQAEFSIVQCYYLGRKYDEAILAYESSDLREVTCLFPAYRDLLIILIDSFSHSANPERSAPFISLLEAFDEEAAAKIELYKAVNQGNLPALSQQFDNPDVTDFLYDYHIHTKSVRTAETLNAVLPGAGYLYVGQKKTALTAFMINAMFVAASYYFFDNNNVPAGIITASIEAGWYFGGINGAGLAAKEYNESIYNQKAKEFLCKQKLFPVLMFDKTF